MKRPNRWKSPKLFDFYRMHITDAVMSQNCRMSNFTEANEDRRFLLDPLLR